MPIAPTPSLDGQVVLVTGAGRGNGRAIAQGLALLGATVVVADMDGQAAEASAELLRVEEGSLYPALHRMEHEGWLASTWGVTEKNRQARFYHITGAGRAQLARERESWTQLSKGVQRVLRHA